jgi:hypothetical protein
VKVFLLVRTLQSPKAAQGIEYWDRKLVSWGFSFASYKTINAIMGTSPLWHHLILITSPKRHLQMLSTCDFENQVSNTWILWDSPTP